jgi:hypothetical protein
MGRSGAESNALDSPIAAGCNVVEPSGQAD